MLRSTAAAAAAIHHLIAYLGLGGPRVPLLEPRVAGVQLEVFVVDARRRGVEVALRLVQPCGLQDVGAFQSVYFSSETMADRRTKRTIKSETWQKKVTGNRE